MGRLDRIIEKYAPQLALKREVAKMQISNMRKYEAASISRRTENWRSDDESARVSVGNDIHRLRERSRQLVRDNPYAKRAIEIIKNNVVGDGITATPASESKRHVELWKDWALTTKIDFDGKHNIYGLQALAVRTKAESGEVLFRIRKDKNLVVPFQLQILEGDFIDDEGHNNGMWGKGNNEHYGIKYDEKGKILGYWLWENHPGDNSFNMKSNFIPASEIIHMYEVLRPGQSRGVPAGVSAMTTLKNLDSYQDAQLERQKAAACFVAFVTNGTQKPATPSEANNLHNERLTPGLIQYLGPNEEITFGNPPVPEDAEFQKGVLQAVAIGYGISYESLTGDLSNVNFSSGRMGWMEMSRNMKALQWEVVIPQFLDKVYELFEMTVQMKYGIEPVGVQWTVPKRIMIDPVKEINALIKEVRAGFKSWEEAVRENGYDPKQLLIELKKNYQEFKDMGFSPESIPAFDPDRIKKMEGNKSDTNKQK